MLYMINISLYVSGSEIKTPVHTYNVHGMDTRQELKQICL